MFQLIDFPADTDHVVAIEVDGEVETHEFKKILEVVEDKLDRHDKLHIYVEIKALGKVSPQALFDDIKAAVKHWDRFDKQAVVTDNTALQTALKFAGRLVPGIDVRAFTYNERESARQWVIA